MNGEIVIALCVGWIFGAAIMWLHFSSSGLIISREEFDRRKGINNAGIALHHTAVNKDMHLFIKGDHDPKLCPECIKPGALGKKNDD